MPVVKFFSYRIQLFPSPPIARNAPIKRRLLGDSGLPPYPVTCRGRNDESAKKKLTRDAICYGLLTIMGLFLAANPMCSCQRAGAVTICSYALLGTDIVICNSDQHEVFPSPVDVTTIKPLKKSESFPVLCHYFLGVVSS